MLGADKKQSVEEFGWTGSSRARHLLAALLACSILQRRRGNEVRREHRPGPVAQFIPAERLTFLLEK